MDEMRGTQELSTSHSWRDSIAEAQVEGSAPIPGEMKGLSDDLQQLRETFGILRRRLEPVVNSRPSDGSKPGLIKEDGISGITAWLMDSRTEIAILNNDLHDLINRIEL